MYAETETHAQREVVCKDVQMRRLALLIVFSFLLLFACAPTARTSERARKVFYAGGNNQVKVALLEAGYTLTDDLERADVLVLNGTIPDAKAISTKLRTGAGLVLIIGAGTSYRDVEALINYPVTALISSDDVVGLAPDIDFAKNDPLVKGINWNEAPEISNRATILTSAPGTPLIRVKGHTEVVIGEIGSSSQKKFAIDVYLDEQHNLQFQKWKYFDYLIYHLVERAAGAEPMPFAEYTRQTK